jgi:hypothetical protein
MRADCVHRLSSGHRGMRANGLRPGAPRVYVYSESTSISGPPLRLRLGRRCRASGTRGTIRWSRVILATLLLCPILGGLSSRNRHMTCRLRKTTAYSGADGNGIVFWLRAEARCARVFVWNRDEYRPSLYSGFTPSPTRDVGSGAVTRKTVTLCTPSTRRMWVSASSSPVHVFGLGG